MYRTYELWIHADPPETWKPTLRKCKFCTLKKVEILHSENAKFCTQKQHSVLRKWKFCTQKWKFCTYKMEVLPGHEKSAFP